MATDVIIDPSTGQIYWNDSAGVGTESISIKGDAVNTISFTGYSGSFSPGSTPAGALTLVTIKDSAGTDALIPGTTGYNLGSSTLRWNTFASNANLSGTLVVSDSTISSSLITGSTRINGGIAISGNASIGQSLNFYNTAATFYTGFKAGTISANTLYTLPTAFPGSASLLQSDASGTLTWVGAVGTATTAQNINIVSASTSASHPVLFTPSAGTASGAALSTESTFVYNPSTDILSVSGLAVTSNTASTSPTTGALIVAGGAGIAKTSYFGQDVIIQGTTTSSSPTTGALLVTGGVGISGKLSVGGGGVAISGLLLVVNENGYNAQFVGSTNSSTIVTIRNKSSGFIAASALGLLNNDGARSIEIGIGATDNTWNALLGFGNHVPTNFGFVAGWANNQGLSVGAGTTLILFAGANSNTRITLTGLGVSIAANNSSTSTSTGGLTVVGGAGIGGSIFGGSTISAADNIEIKSGKELRLNNSGNTFYTGLKAGANTSNTTYTFPAAFPGAGTSVLQSDTSGNLTWTGIVGNATTAQNINIVSASTSASHPVLFTPSAGTASGAALSTESTFVYNPSTDILSVSGLAITSGTASTSSTTGALTVSGGVGIGGSLYTSIGSSSSVSGVILANGNVSATTYNKLILTAPATSATLTLGNGSSLITSGGHSLTFNTSNTTSLTLPTTGTLATTSNKLSDFAATTSLELLNTITGETGSGALVFATSPDFTTSVTTGSGTFALFNATATTINAFGAATVMSIGAATGKATFNSTDDSSSTITGGLVVSGGAGIAKSVSIGGRLQMFNGANFTAFVSSASGNTVYTLPATSPATGSSVLQSTSAGVMSWVPLAASAGGVATGVASRMAYYATSGAAVTDSYGFQYTTAGQGQTVSIFGGAAIGNTIFVVSTPSSTSIKVGIGVSNPQFELEVNGEISATNKSFVINHPTKPGMKLRYGSLEGPENGVYVRGISTSNIIDLPDYWLGLVDYNTITVHLTPIGKNNSHYFVKCEDNKVYIGTSLFKKINCFYSIWAERRDIPKLTVEY